MKSSSNNNNNYDKESSMRYYLKKATTPGILRKPIFKGVMAGAITLAVYLTIVIVTSPSIAPADAVNAAFQLNAGVIAGIAIGVGLQMFLSSYSKTVLGCPLSIGKRKGAAFGGNSGGTAASSFFSFFALVPLGCCGWWLYAISFLPGLFGVGVSGFLVDHSQALAYLGIAVIFGFDALAAYKIIQIKQEMKKRMKHR